VAAPRDGAEAGPADQVVAEIKKLGSDAVANYDNVADFEAGNRMVQQALDSFGRLDILINNAGILRDKMIFNMSEEEWDIVLAVHLKGHFNLSKHAAVVFRQQRSGVFVHTASESGLGNRGRRTTRRRRKASSDFRARSRATWAATACARTRSVRGRRRAS
jgi:NAD(P)-dependent dehydrogenase (short-subunit alcohol dehydrogenase family)